MYVPTPIIGRNLQVLAEELHLGATEVNGMQHGDPLTLVVDDDVAVCESAVVNSPGNRCTGGVGDSGRKAVDRVRNFWEEAVSMI